MSVTEEESEKIMQEMRDWVDKLKDLIENQKPCPPEFTEIINKNFNSLFEVDTFIMSGLNKED